MRGTGSEQRSLVGRSSEEAELEAELARAGRGEFRCVFLEGAAGIGKTRLATEFSSRLRPGTLRLTARGYPFGATSSFGLWAEALEGHLRGVEPAELRELCGGFLDDLAGLLRSVAAIGAVGEREEPSAARLLQALATLLDDLSADRPVVILLDDLHLADVSSWEALDYLAHNLSRSPVLVIGCLRSEELVEPAPRQLLFRLEQSGILRRISLPPLREEHLRELATSRLPGTAVPQALVSWLSERSGGNVLFAVALLDELISEGRGVSAPFLATVPKPLRERLVGRLDELGSEAREVLDVLAVVGRRVDLRDLRRFSRRSLDALAETLRGLDRANLIVEHEQSSQPTYEIDHPLVREVAYEELGGARLRALHRRIGRGLVSDSRFAEAASHYARSADVGDEEAIAALERAARQAWARQAFPEALRVMESLLELVPPGDERWLGVLDVMSLDGDWLSYHGGDADFVLGEEVLRRVAPLIEKSPDPRRLATFNLHLACFCGWGGGDLREAIRRGQRSVELFRRADDDARARMAATELAWIEGVEGDFEAQERRAAQVIEAAEVAGDPANSLMALAARAATLWPRGRFEDAEAAYRRSEELARAEGNLPRRRYALAFLAFSLALEGRLGDARLALDQAIKTDPAGIAPPAVEVGVFISWFSGELGATLAQVPERAGESVGSSWVMLVGALAALESDDTPAARRCLEAVEDVIASRRYWLMRHPYRWARGLVVWHEGDVDAASVALGSTADDLLRIDAVTVASYVLADLAEVAWEAGEAQRAEGAAAQLEEVAGRIGRDHYHALGAMTRGWARLADGDHRSAAASAQRAVEHFAGRSYRGLEARSLEVLGRALAPSDPARAVDTFEDAVDLFETCGARWRQDRVLAVLGGLGKRGRRVLAAVAGPDSLTPREREVAGLAAEGLTAKEIGERLFIGKRTVETHLANTYAKLGVGSRVELADRARELHL